ncbi:hypothetical protein, partial [Microbacterium laevaniformans]|uniref:hypothetical protein n=1 Tax=Microbacterium laevaniformans TaxID=36807 RepID=UPI0022F29F9E
MFLLVVTLTVVAGLAQMIGVLLLVSRAIAARKLMRSGAHLLISGGGRGERFGDRFGLGRECER